MPILVQQKCTWISLRPNSHVFAFKGEVWRGFLKFLVLSKLKPFYKSTLKNPVYLQPELIADCAALLSVIPIISLFRQPWHLNRVISTGCQSCHSCQTFPVAATSISQAPRSNSSVLGPRTRANCQKGRGKNGQDPVLTGGRRWPMAKKCKKYFRFWARDGPGHAFWGERCHGGLFWRKIKKSTL